MCEAVEKYGDYREARGITKGEAIGIINTRFENISHIMGTLKYSAEQAMDLLQILMAERGQLLDMLAK